MEVIQIANKIRAAIKQDDADSVVALIRADKSRLEMMTPFGSCLHVAAHHGKLDIVKRLIDMGADVNARGGICGGKPLNEAAAEGYFDVVKYLLSRGADLDVEVSEQNPLFSAIYGGHTAIAKLLIDNGIDTQIKYTGKYMKDMDALAFAREWGRSEIIDLLTSSEKK